MSAEPDAGREFRGGTILGEERGGESVEVVSYDPAWPVRYEQVRARLAHALGPIAARIEHVGSTAVPGLAAKPVVDIQVSVGDLDAETAYRPAIETLGLGLRYRKDDWRYFRPVPGIPRDFHVHVCRTGSEWERRHLLFRDYMRTHPDRAAEYGALKLDLAPQFGLDRVGYTDAKVPFIDAVLRDAEEWASQVGWQP